MEGLIFFLLYSAWAVYSGYKNVNGKYEWLEQPQISSKICKALFVLGAGYVFGAFYFIKWILKIAIWAAGG